MAPRPGRALHWLVLLAALAVAYLGGVLTERLRFDAQRKDVIEKYDKALRAWQEQQMQTEKESAASASR